MSEPWMKKNIVIPAFFLLFTMLLFLFFPVTSFEGAKSGLLLWFHQVLPSLLPFLILTNLLLSLGLHKVIGNILYPVLHPVFGCSKSGCFAIVTGLLSGLPVGAKIISDLYQNNELSKKEGQSLLALCCNPSPMFLISYAGVAKLGLIQQPYLVFLFVLISAILSHFSLRLYSYLAERKGTKKHGKSSEHSKSNDNYPIFSFSMMDSCIMNSFEITAKVGGYIVLFNIYASILPVLLPVASFPLIGQILQCVLEISTGIHAVCHPMISPKIALVLVVACCNFCGLSGIAQTKSVLSNRLLPFRLFIIMKLWQCVLGVLLTSTYLLMIAG